jgi:hypothetical protein
MAAILIGSLNGTECMSRLLLRGMRAQALSNRNVNCFWLGMRSRGASSGQSGRLF